MIETSNLTLTVSRNIPGELITNALAIKAFVESRVKEYTSEKYYDDPDAAKRDRAELNAASKELNTRRLAMEREFMRPFVEFKGIIKQTTDAIDYAASQLDEVVKAVEDTIKADKMEKIEAIFKDKEFYLVPLAKLYDQKWLNKGTSLNTVKDELTAKIGQVYVDIATLEELPFDAAEAKANYLETLDIGQALATAQRMKANRERLDKEVASRPERLHNEQIQTQKMELAMDAAIESRSDPIRRLAAEVLGEEDDPIIEYTIKFKGTRSQLISLRTYMNTLGLEYEKVGAA